MFPMFTSPPKLTHLDNSVKVDYNTILKPLRLVYTKIIVFLT